MRWVVALFGVVILAVVFVFGLQFALAEAGDTTQVTNETWFPNSSTWQPVNDSDVDRAIFTNQTTVYDENQTLMNRTGDYKWEKQNASLFTRPGGRLVNDSNATVSYTYSQPSVEQQQFANLVSLIPRSVGVMLPVFGLIMFLAFLIGRS